MSVCRFIASDMPLTAYEPSQEYPFHVNIDEGIIDDGGADDNYFLLDFPDVDLYTNKEYGVSLEWEYTDGRAKQIIEYIKNALLEIDNVEFDNASAPPELIKLLEAPAFAMEFIPTISVLDK